MLQWQAPTLVFTVLAWIVTAPQRQLPVASVVLDVFIAGSREVINRSKYSSK
jgi:hypothetical protein